MRYSWQEPRLMADERRRRYEQASQEALFVPALAEEDDEIGEVKSQSSNRSTQPPAQKRRRVAPFTSVRSRPTSPVGLDPPTMIKSEAESDAVEALLRRPLNERVKIYIGQNNGLFVVGLEELQESPILKSLVNHNGKAGPYIMHPELTQMSTEYFASVREFLLTREYMPALVNNPKGDDILPKQLDDCNTPGHYRKQALRNAHLYVLAKSLGIETLQNLVFSKITQAEYHSYGIECLLNMAMVIFSRPENIGLVEQGKPCKQEDPVGDDHLEKWIVEKLVDNYQTMMTLKAQLFFEVANHAACRKRQFEVRVLRLREGHVLNGTDKTTIVLGDDDDDDE